MSAVAYGSMAEVGTAKAEQDANGVVWVQVEFRTMDAGTAKRALDAGFVQTLVGACQATSADCGLPADRLLLTIQDAQAQVLLKYTEDLASGRATAYHAGAIGSGWTEHGGQTTHVK